VSFVLFSSAFTASVCADENKTKDTSSAVSTATTTAQNANTLGKVERSNKLIGKEVYSSDNQKIGKIDNLIVDLESGHVLYAVVNAKNKVAVAPGIFQEPSRDRITATVDKAKLEGAPEFTSDMDKRESMAKADFVSQVYQYFGQNAWWQGATAANAGSFNNVHKASDLDGMKVFNTSNETIGMVDNLAIDLPAGRVVYVIFSPASSLKLGNNLYALPPNAFTLSSDQKNLVTGIDQSKFANAPHFAKNQWPNLSSPTYAQQVYQYYGKDLWFHGGLQPTGR
jgi:sporulation protein YlmC with PRC-barrel domain